MKAVGKSVLSRLLGGVTVTTVLMAVLGCDAFGVESDEQDTEGEKGTEPLPFRHNDTDTGSVNADGILYPGVNWPSADPEDEGMDGELLAEAAELAEENDSHCFVVTKGGKIVGEWYYDDWNEASVGNVFSVTKAITALVAGVAEAQDLLDIEQRASEFIPDWQDTASETVLIRHLLSNTSGRVWDFNGDYLQMALETDKTAYALGRGQAEEPGEHWEYNNAAVQVLDEVIKEAVGESVLTFAEENLFRPIGAMSEYYRDSEMNTLTYSELKSSCRDLARFGYLVLRDGKWGDEQLIEKPYIAEATAPSSELNSAYGYLWWLNQDGHWVAPATSGTGSRDEGDGKMLPTSPEHIIYARGFQSQLIVVDKENEIVFTRIGGDDNVAAALLEGSLTNDEFVGGLINRVLGAVAE